MSDFAEAELFQTMSDGLSVYDADRRLVYANAQAALIRKRPVHELLGFRDEETVARHLRDQYLPALERVYETGTPQEAEVRLGGFTPGAVSLLRFHPVLNDAGTVDRVVALSFDVTKQKRIEERARVSEERAGHLLRELEAALDTIADGVCLYDARGNLVRMNRSAREILGLNGNDAADEARLLSSLTFRSLRGHRVSLDDTFVRQALDGEVVKDRPLRYVHRESGRSRWITLSALPVLRGSGAVVGAVVTWTDSTEQRWWDEQRDEILTALSTERARLTAVIENAPVGIVMTDQDGKIVLSNPAAESLHDRPLPIGELYTDTMGLSAGDLHPGTSNAEPAAESGPRSQENAGSDAATGGTASSGRELMLPGPDGRVRWILVDSASIEDDRGQRRGAVGIFRDITHLKQLELDLRSARDRAESANRAKSEFLTHMTHEIRTPIHSILGLTEVLSLEANDPSQRQYLSMIRDSAHSLLSLIGNVLDIAAIESEKTLVKRQDFDLRRDLEMLARTAAVTAAEKGLSFALRCHENTPDAVHGDRDHILQVLRNLVSNAVKYTRRGEVTVLCDVPRRKDGKLWLRFIVADTGVGIPPEWHARLFQNFSRVRDMRNTDFEEGSGLGLVISKRLAELLGGDIEFESEVDRGSAFRFEVPVEPVTSAPETEDAAASSGSDADPAGAEVNPLRLFRPLTILVADDNRINRMILETLLTNAGHRVFLAEDGWQAVDLVEREAIEVVLLDIQMPGLDGLDATRKIRRDAKHGRIPIIGLSALALKEEEARCLEAGMDGFVSKPADMTRLADEIRLHLPDSALARSGPRV